MKPLQQRSMGWWRGFIWTFLLQGVFWGLHTGPDGTTATDITSILVAQPPGGFDESMVDTRPLTPGKSRSSQAAQLSSAVNVKMAPEIIIYEDLMPLVLNMSIPKTATIIDSGVVRSIAEANPACNRREDKQQQRNIRKNLLKQTSNITNFDDFQITVQEHDPSDAIRANCLAMNATMLVLQELQEFISTEQAESSLPSRQRRNVVSDAIGSFFEFCCSLATTKSLSSLRQNSDSSKAFLDKLKRNFDIDHQAIVEEGQVLNKMGANLANFSSNMISELNSVYSRLKGVTSEEKSLNTLFTQGLTITTQLMARSFSESMWKAGELLCLQNLFPHTIMDTNLLLEKVREQNTQLLLTEREIAIPESQWHKLIELPLSTCMLTHDEATVLVKLPIKKTGNSYSKKRLQTFPFYTNDTVCTVAIKPALMASKGSTTFMLDDHDPLCRQGLCQVGLYAHTFEKDQQCYDVLFQGGSIQEIVSKCMIQCEKRDLPHVVKLDQNLFSIINDQPMSVMCTKPEKATPLPPIEFGSQLVHMRCHCKIVSFNSGTIVVEEQVPCLTSTESTHITSHFPIFLADLEKFGALSHTPHDGKKRGGDLSGDAAQHVDQRKLSRYGVQYKTMNLTAVEEEVDLGEVPTFLAWTPPYLGFDYLLLVINGVAIMASVYGIYKLRNWMDRVRRLERVVREDLGAPLVRLTPPNNRRNNNDQPPPIVNFRRRGSAPEEGEEAQAFLNNQQGQPPQQEQNRGEGAAGPAPAVQENQLPRNQGNLPSVPARHRSASGGRSSVDIPPNIEEEHEEEFANLHQAAALRLMNDPSNCCDNPSAHQDRFFSTPCPARYPIQQRRPLSPKPPAEMNTLKRAKRILEELGLVRDGEVVPPPPPLPPKDIPGREFHIATDDQTAGTSSDNP
jgi:hypothetical protein